jgi:uroporphyrinogen-III synthase
MRKLLLLRPEPGLSASAERARAMGLYVITCPLFRVDPVHWSAPDPAAYDALLLTSANVIRHGGDGLEALKSLPVHAVGTATAAAAEEASFPVQTVGSGNLGDLLAKLPTSLRLLHLTGEDRREAPADRQIDHLIVYRSVQIEAPDLPNLEGLVAAVHSPRAGRRLAELTAARHRTAIAAISAEAAEACDRGWERIEVAEHPNDPSLLALAAALCHTSPRE